ncbi:hypothetical protein O181_097842 [Austropuccinia psidii MF-1]|uniref:Uncharacterized protein n=1 Tax=Austropuccinia psidii MF-1 TaxID=1389203 RepID=A0A9Q3PEW7_9BASI|nr:hypothetical protein [Austropuccinia psidii MF-1]
MTTFHKSGNIHKNADGLSRWALENTPENTEWVPQEEPHIEGIYVTDIGTEFFNIVEESYNMDKHFHILFQLLMKDCKYPSLTSKLDERKDVAEYCQTCDRFQKENKAVGKKFAMMIKIKEQKSPWEIFHMDWVAALPPGGDRSFNSFLVLFDR